MKTLVERLRDWDSYADFVQIKADCAKAADEIDHLRAALLAAKRGHTRECLAHHFPCTCGTDFHNAAIDAALEESK